MVKVCVNFKNSLFVWVYLKVFFFMGCFYLVFIFQNFGSLVPLIFLNNFFLSKFIFSHMKRCISFVFMKRFTSFSRILSFGVTSDFFKKLQQIFQIVAISWKNFEFPRVFFFCCATFFSQKICFSNKKKFKSIWNFFLLLKRIFWEKREFVKKVN